MSSRGFITLPLEIRQMVYEKVLVHERPITIYRASACLQHPRQINHCPGILLANKQIYYEAAPLVFRNAVKLELVDHLFHYGPSMLRNELLAPWNPLPVTLNPHIAGNGSRGTISIDNLHRFRHVEIEYNFEQHSRQTAVWGNSTVKRYLSTEEALLFSYFRNFIIALGEKAQGEGPTSNKVPRTLDIVIPDTWYIIGIRHDLTGHLRRDMIFKYLKNVERTRAIGIKLGEPAKSEADNLIFRDLVEAFREEIEAVEVMDDVV